MTRSSATASTSSAIGMTSTRTATCESRAACRKQWTRSSIRRATRRTGGSLDYILVFGRPDAIPVMVLESSDWQRLEGQLASDYRRVAVVDDGRVELYERLGHGRRAGRRGEARRVGVLPGGRGQLTPRPVAACAIRAPGARRARHPWRDGDPGRSVVPAPVHPAPDRPCHAPQPDRVIRARHRDGGRRPGDGSAGRLPGGPRPRRGRADGHPGRRRPPDRALYLARADRRRRRLHPGVRTPGGGRPRQRLGPSSASCSTAAARSWTPRRARSPSPSRQRGARPSASTSCRGRCRRR